MCAGAPASDPEPAEQQHQASSPDHAPRSRPEARQQLPRSPWSLAASCSSVESFAAHSALREPLGPQSPAAQPADLSRQPCASARVPHSHAGAVPVLVDSAPAGLGVRLEPTPYSRGRFCAGSQPGCLSELAAVAAGKPASQDQGDAGHVRGCGSGCVILQTAALAELGRAAAGALLSLCIPLWLAMCTTTCIGPQAGLDVQAHAPTHDHCASSRTDAAAGKGAGRCRSGHSILWSHEFWE